jgi:acyl-homoserine-lactone acylase
VAAAPPRTCGCARSIPTIRLNTPRDLNTENPRTHNSLGLAVKELRDAGIPLAAPLGDHQSEPRGDERIPIHGGPGKIGVFNQIEAPFAGSEGFPDVVHGTSFLMAAELTGRCPRVRTILAYSQSTDPTSPFHADQTRLFSARRWVRGRFCEEEIRRAPGLRVTRLGGGAGGRPPARRPSLTG